MNEEYGPSTRDADLVKALCGISNESRRVLNEWMQEELRDLQRDAQILTGDGYPDRIRLKAREELELIESMYFSEVDRLNRRHKDRVRELDQPYMTDPFHVLTLLAENTLLVESRARMLFELRKRMNALLDTDEPNPDEDDEYVEE